MIKWIKFIFKVIQAWFEIFKKPKKKKEVKKHDKKNKFCDNPDSPTFGHGV